MTKRRPEKSTALIFCRYTTEQEVLPRTQHGVDWGRPRPVLVRLGSRVAFTIPGHQGWAQVGRQKYYPSRFVLFDEADRTPSARDLFEGRVTRAKLEAVEPQLQAFFGPDFRAQYIERGMTLLQIREGDG